MGWKEAVAAALPSSDPVVLEAHLDLEPDARNVSVARRFVAERVGALEAGVRHDLLLITSELVTNGVVHARTPLELVLIITKDSVFIGVHDLDLGRSEMQGHERDGGRGLSLVRELASECGQTVHDEGGKTAWACMCREERSA